MFAMGGVLVAAVLFAAMVALQDVGRRLGERERRLSPDHESGASSVAEGAVFALLGLFLAFTFSGAGSRFDARRQLIVEEANAIGTAWLRLDVLPADQQPALRDLFRRYVDARLNPPTLRAGIRVADQASTDATQLQQQIWSASVAAARASGQVAPFTVLLPALNDMIDITTTRAAAVKVHPPAVVFVMVGVLALVGSVFVGYGTAGRRTSSWLHKFGFAAVMTVALYVILDLEFPRVGLIRVDAMDQVIVDLRRSMD